MSTKDPSRAIWQISGGPSSRLYSDVFLDCGVALIGPGDSGQWRLDRSDEEFGGNFIRRFASEVQQGDVFLLRTGRAAIRAVGIVASDYLYLETFDDINGLDLQHARRVRWCELPEDHEFKDQVFGAGPPCLSRVHHEEVRDYVDRFLNSPPDHWREAELPVLPPEEALLDEHGIPSQLRSIIAEIRDLHPLIWEGGAFGERPSEDEMLAHFVVPFLKALGWATEQIAIQWRRIDVTVFREIPRIPENCHFVIEVKRIGEGVEGALEQAKSYVNAIGCSCDVVVTDGIRYRIYDARNDFRSVAYANLSRLKKSATELFERMKRL